VRVARLARVRGDPVVGFDSDPLDERRQGRPVPAHRCLGGVGHRSPAVRCSPGWLRSELELCRPDELPQGALLGAPTIRDGEAGRALPVRLTASEVTQV